MAQISRAKGVRNLASWESPRECSQRGLWYYSVVKVAPGWVPDRVASSKMLAALVDGWPGTAREVVNNRWPEIATSAHASPGRAVALKNRQFASVASVSSLPRLPAAERSDRNRTTRRRPRNASCTRSIGGRLKLRPPTADDDGGDHDAQLRSRQLAT